MLKQNQWTQLKRKQNQATLSSRRSANNWTALKNKPNALHWKRKRFSDVSSKMSSIEQRNGKYSKKQKNITLDTEKKNHLRWPQDWNCKTRVIVLNVFKDLKGTLARKATQMTNAAENRKWGKNKWEFGGVRSGRKEESTAHTSQERPVEGRALLQETRNLDIHYRLG